jgi:outer membrane scaffolding protein for murein synthesis (MipA/OmpV family)
VKPIIALLATAIAAAPALAQDPADDRNSLTIGLGIGVAPDYEGSNDYMATPAGLAFGKVEGFSFYTRATTLYIDLVRESDPKAIDFAVGFAGNLRIDRHSVDDPRIEALGELDRAIELGAFVGVGKTGIFHEYDTAAARVHVVKDVTDTHDGIVVQPMIEYGTPLSRKAYVGLQLSADYVDQDFADTYYGVDAAGSLRSTLPVYDADSGWKNVRVSLLGTHSLTGDLTTGGLSLFAIGSYSSLLGDFKRSPLVREAGDADQYFAAIGLSYSF